MPKFGTTERDSQNFLKRIKGESPNPYERFTPVKTASILNFKII
jgi:hypothetical protein